MKTMKLIVAIVVTVAATMEGQQASKKTNIKVHLTVDKPPLEITGNIARTAKVMNYRTSSGITNVHFQGTSLLPNVHGVAAIQPKQDHVEIHAEFDELQSATRFGPEYLTYVLWAIAPEGSTTNLGELVPNGAKNMLNVTTELLGFGMIVTAEPYFAVSQPSEIVVMENVFTTDWTGNEPAEANYELLPRGSYTLNV